MNLKFFLIFFTLIASAGLYADAISIGFFSDQNSGEFVYQTYNYETAGSFSNPLDFSHFNFIDFYTKRGGSTIVYERNFPHYGMNLGYEKKRFEFSGRVSSTLRTVKAGIATDQDYRCTGCRVREPRIDLFALNINDTAYAVDYNIEDAYSLDQGKNEIFEQGFLLSMNYFLKSGSYEKNKNFGFYFQFGLQHLYSRYNYRDAFNSRVRYYGIGTGIITKIKRQEISYGMGYRSNWKNFIIEPAISLLTGREDFEDKHFYRNLTFMQISYGDGFQYRFTVDRMFGDGVYLAGITLYGHRFYLNPGMFRPLEKSELYGGITAEDIKNNIIYNSLNALPRFTTGTKESGIEFHVTGRYFK